MDTVILHKYLVQHKSISIPGLGALVIEAVPSISDFVNRQIHPVQQKIRFDKYFDAPSRDFYNYLSQQNNIPDFEAIRLYNEFAYDLRNEVRTKGKAALRGVGEFVKDLKGEVYFEPYRSPYELYPTVPAVRVMRSSVDHAILVGDKEKTAGEMAEFLNEEHLLMERGTVASKKWTKIVLVIALLALALLVFHHLRNGFRWGSVGNRQSLGAVYYGKQL